MKIKKIELNNFKRFTHLSVEDIPETTKLVVLVGPNGSGKTSFMEAMNHYYKCAGYNDAGDYHYLSKAGNVEEFNYFEWRSRALKLVTAARLSQISLKKSRPAVLRKVSGAKAQNLIGA